MYSRHLTKESYKRNCYSTEAPMKKLISEEISKRPSTRQNAPSLVARLMGVDILPFDPGEAPKIVEKKKETTASNFMEKEESEKSSFGCNPSMLNASAQLDLDSSGYNIDRYSDHCYSRMKLKKPKPREHPQEEELQRFKKEFEAWQSARFKEYSKVVDFGNAPNQLKAQNEHSRENRSLYDNSKRMITSERLMESKDLSVMEGPLDMVPPRNCRKNKSKRISKMDFQSSQLMITDQKLDSFSSPTKIVILRPGPDRIGISDDSCNSTPSTLEERVNIEDFLEEVKERLKSEMHGKSSKRSSTVRGGRNETLYREKSSEPRQIAHRIAQQVRDCVTRDLGMNLLRSESTRSYKSDIQFNGAGSPEFVNRDTRRLLTERLRNVLKGETHREVPLISHKSSRSSPLLDYEKLVAPQSRDVLWRENKTGCSEIFMNDIEEQSRSFRQNSYEKPSPRNLIRSLSAPVSGASFGKLLLEDRHILTGAQIRRKHEVVDNVSMNVKKHKKHKFNIREKVSSFGYSLTLRGRLFRRRVQSVEELQFNKNDLFKDITSGPTVMMSFYETHANFTEVPPSPASVCSSVCDELWRPVDYSSPTSSGIHQLEESEMPHAFSQINSNLNGQQETIIEDQPQPHEVEIDIEDPAQAYIKDLLVASGLYDSSCNRTLSKWDPLGKAISNQIFEEVEESFKQSTKVDERCGTDEGSHLNHKMILDLVNEVLEDILTQPQKMSAHMQKDTNPVHRPPRGMKLLLHVWEIISVYLHPPPDRSYYALESMLARDMTADLWPKLMHDDISAMGKDIESHIIGDLIEEMVKGV